MILSSHLLHDLERVCDHVILLAESHTQLCDDIEDVLASHRMLVGHGGARPAPSAQSMSSRPPRPRTRCA